MDNLIGRVTGKRRSYKIGKPNEGGRRRGDNPCYRSLSGEPRKKGKRGKTATGGAKGEAGNGRWGVCIWSPECDFERGNTPSGRIRTSGLMYFKEGGRNAGN